MLCGLLRHHLSLRTGTSLGNCAWRILGKILGCAQAERPLFGRTPGSPDLPTILAVHFFERSALSEVVNIRLHLSFKGFIRP